MPLSIAHTQDQLEAAIAQGNHHTGVRAIVAHLRSHGQRPSLRQAVSLFRACSASPSSIADTLAHWKTTIPDQP